jgi:hypothetical protein
MVLMPRKFMLGKSKTTGRDLYPFLVLMEN